MWKALRLAGEDVGRGHVERLMRRHGICGAKRRGKPWRTTQPDLRARRRPDLVNRNFAASELELAIVKWVGWFNTTRLHSALDDLSPRQFEEQSNIPMIINSRTLQPT